MKIVTDNTVNSTSQNIGKVAHDTAGHSAHKRSHAIAEEISQRHDRHSYQQSVGLQVHNTRHTGEDHGLEDGRDEQTPVEKN